MTGIAWLTWTALAITACAVIWRWVRVTGELVAPLPICAGTVAFYALPRAAYLLAFNRPPLTSGALLPYERSALIAETLALCLCSVVAFLTGHRAKGAAAAAGRIRFALPDPEFRRAAWVALVLTLVGLGAVVFLVRSLGDLRYAIEHQSQVTTLLQGKQWMFQLTILPAIACAVVLVDQARRRSRPWVWVLALLTLISLFPFGLRAFMLIAAGLPLTLYHLTVRHFRTRYVLVAALLGAATLFSLNYLRFLGGERLQRAARVLATRPASGVHFTLNASGELKVFDAATILVRDTPSEISFNYGAPFARVPWMIIPRRIWRDKPVTSGHFIVQRYLPRLKTAYPPMAVGEFFMAGGVLAVLLGFWCLGWISRVAWEWFRAHPGVGNASLYLAFCFFVFDFTRVGDPGRTVWLFLIASAFLSIAFCVSSPSLAFRPSPRATSGDARPKARLL